MFNRCQAEVRPYDHCIDIYAVWNGNSGVARMDWETAKRILRELEDAIDLYYAKGAMNEPGSTPLDAVVKGTP